MPDPAGIYGHLLGLAILMAINASAPLIVGRAAVTGHDSLADAFIDGVLLDAFALAFACSRASSHAQRHAAA